MNDVNAYLDALPEPQKAELTRVRNLVKAYVPEAKESISYATPAFKYKNKPLVYYAAFKDHMSLFPTGITDELQDKLHDYTVSKGTIQFTVDKPLSNELITEILDLRIAQIG